MTFASPFSFSVLPHSLRPEALALLLLAGTLLYGGLLPAHAQTATSVQPRSGAPGTSVRIYGSGLSTGDAVTFGGTTATVENGTGTALTVTVPSGPAGTVDISVNGTSLPGAFDIVTGGPGFFSTLNTGLTGLQEGAVAWSDFDGDGRRDFVALGSASFTPTTKIYRNEGGGSFSEFTSLYGVAVGSADWGDLDGDGDPDLVITGTDNDFNAAIRVYENDVANNNGFIRRTVSLPSLTDSSVELGDLNGDGTVDLLLTGNDGSTPLTTAYANTGGYTFSLLDATAGSGTGFTDVEDSATDLGDVDGDGDLDLVLTGIDGGGNKIAAVYLNDVSNGNGFSLLNPDGNGSSMNLTPVSSGDVDWGDVDNDGDLDLVIVGANSASDATATIYENDGSENFSVFDEDGDGDTMGLTPVVDGDSNWGDVDGDGDLDLVLNGLDSAAIYENDVANENGFQLLNDDGTGTTTAFEDIRLSSSELGDFDSDGDLDVLLMGSVSSAERTLIYENASPPVLSVRQSQSTLPDGATIDAGTIPQGTNLTTTLTVKNTGSDGSLKVTGYSGSNATDFSTAAPSTLPVNIPAGTSRPFEITLNASELGTYSTSVTFETTDFSKSPFTLTVEGTVVEGKVTTVRPRAAVPGSTVRIQGAGFTSDTEIAFGSAPSVSPDSVYPGGTAMDVPVPSGLSGPVPVSVTFPGGSARTAAAPVDVVTGGGGFFTDIPASVAAVEEGLTDWIDVDSDGDLDLFLTGRNRSGTRIAAVYLNDGTGSFTLLNPDGNGNTDGLRGVTRASSAWGDYDDDGDPDLLLTGRDDSFSPSTTLYENNVNGGTAFSTVSAGLTGVVDGSSSWGDADGDGDLDLVVTGSDGSPPTATIYRNEGGGSFSVVNDDGNGNTASLTPVSRSASAWTDLEPDGDLDLVIVGSSAGQPSAAVYRNDGSGTFSIVNDVDTDGSTDGLTGVTDGAVAWGNFDDVPGPDLVIAGTNASSSPTTTVYTNDVAGGTGFSVASTTPDGIRNGSVKWSDVDGDGDDDLFVSGNTTPGSVAALYENTGGSLAILNPTPGGNSVALTSLENSSADWADMDGDGDLDLTMIGGLRRGAETVDPATLIYKNVTAPPSVLYVSPNGSDSNDGGSWSTAYRTLQKALQRALPSVTEQIWVAEGRYTPDQGPNVTAGDPAASFALVDSVDIFGGFVGTETSRSERDPRANPTILSGDLEGNDLDPNEDGILTSPTDIQGSNSYNIVTGIRLASTVRLDGLVLTGGDARSDDSFTQSSGGAIHLGSGAVRGIGLTIIGNRAGGMVGEGGALFGEPSTSFKLANSVVAGNSASRGSAFAGPGEVAFVNSALVGHTGSSAVIRGGGTVRLLSVTATQNEGPVAETSGSRIRAENSIFWQNDTAGTGVQLRPLIPGTTVDLNHVLLEGNLTDGIDLTSGSIGTQISILDQDPQFENPDGADNTFGTSDDNLRVPSTSPAFDAGDASLLPTDAPDLDEDDNTAEPIPVDLAGTPRVVNGALDLGALETNPSPTLSTIADTTIDEDTAFNTTLTIGDLNDPLSALTFSTESSNPALVANADVSVSGTGSDRSLVVTPRPDSNSANGTGPTTITIGANDGTTTTRISFQLSVNAVNDAPRAAPDSIVLAENATVTIPVLENDSDPERALDTSSVTVSTPPSNGTTTVNTETGTITYTPAPGYVGTDEFSYRVADSAGASSDDTPVVLTIQDLALLAVRDTVRAGAIQVGQRSRPLRVVVRNTGEVAVTDLSAALSGPAAADVNLLDAFSSSLPPGEQAAASIAITPSTSGVREAALTVTTAENVMLDIPLRATGVSLGLEAGPATRGQPATFALSIEGNYIPSETAQLYARPGGGTSYKTVPLRPTDTQPSRLEAQVPDSLVTPRGLDYYMVLSNGSDTLTVPGGGTDAAASHPYHLPVSFEELAVPISFEPRTYRMVSVPAQIDGGLLQTLESIYGEYDRATWRLLRWDGAADSYREPPQFDSLAPGMGAWLVSAEGKELILDGQTVNAAAPDSIVLESGWNQIGTPFGFAVPWEKVGTTSERAVDSPVAYKNGIYQYGVSTLKPWNGYFVFNAAPSRDTLVVPPTGPSASSPSHPAALTKSDPGASPDDGSPYTVQINAHTNGSQQSVWVGLRKDATAERDALDFAQAPPINRRVRLSLPETLGGRTVPHAGSFKPPTANGQRWTLRLSHRPGDGSARKVQLQLAERGSLPEAHGQYLLDLKEERRLVSGQTLSLAPGEQRSLTFIVGTRAYAEKESGSIALDAFENELRGNAPNPFDTRTTLSYVLATDQTVTLTIYNVLGQRVRTLVEKKQDRGLHRVSWDGTNQYGRPAGSGVYFYRIEGDDFTATRKMVLVR